MEFNPATTGQYKQLLVKLIQAIPPHDTFSFEEMERLLRDASLPDDFCVMLRRHYQNVPINVIVPEDPILALKRLACEFFLCRGIDSVKVDMNGERESQVQLKQIITRLSHHAEIRPTESTLEVITFDGGLSHFGIAKQLEKMGYSPATADEAAGFLQARGKSYCNPGKSHGPHGFTVIGPDKESISFVTITDGIGSRKWEVWVSPAEQLTLPVSIHNVLAAKL